MVKFFKITRTVLPLLALLAASVFTASAATRDGEFSIHVFTTGDVHGRYFDELYTGGRVRRHSLLAVSAAVENARRQYGRDNVILIDAGDALQGDNAAYYFSYVDTTSVYLFARMTDYMKYDALLVGNHDIETGHTVYDRVRRDLTVPYLAGNAVKADGSPYFDSRTVIERQGLKFLILGYTNANIRNWLSPELWSGMSFLSLTRCVQADVDRAVAEVKPDVVIVAVHSGTGKGNGRELENQGLDLFRCLKGVDALICAHDHRTFVECDGRKCLVNGGSHCRNVGHITLNLKVKNGDVASKNVNAEIVPVDALKVDKKMKRRFAKDFNAVKTFSLRKVGELSMPLVTRTAYRGMSDYMNFLHTVCLGCTGADVSFAAPLSYNNSIESGDVLYNDLLSIYPYENQLFVLTMTGEEIRRYLEVSYDRWINTYNGEGHLLRIENKTDERTGSKFWSFIFRPYNFDSAGGLNYSVDVTADAGHRVRIASMADGTAFNPESTYKVVMTSYRANGGGYLLQEAGIDMSRIGERTVARYPQVRDLIYDFFGKHEVVTPESIGDNTLIGAWSFVPDELAAPALVSDARLLFPQFQ